MSGEPANFTLQDAARWRARTQRKSPRTAGARPPRPTLGELQRTSSWWWVHCARCPHFAAMAFAAPVILWGADMPGDVLRQCARCTACGNKGASLAHPGWGGSGIGFQPFPAVS
jgi:hypothetical protein